MNPKLYARYLYNCNRLGTAPLMMSCFSSTADLINTITAQEADPAYATDASARAQEKARSDARFGRIVGSLDKADRARLRKLIATPDGGWVNAVLPLDVLIRARVRFVPVAA